MMKLVAFVLAVSVFCRWALGKWPWDYLKGPDTRGQALFKARKLLGVGEHASAAEIREAHRRIIAIIHPDRGGNTRDVQDLNAARDLLLNELPHETPERPE